MINRNITIEALTRGAVCITLLLIGIQAGTHSISASPAPGRILSDTTLETLPSIKEVKYEDLSAGEFEFPPGTYYTYKGRPPQTGKKSPESSGRRIDDVKFLLGYLAGSGVEITDAWYKPYSSQCSPPDSKKAMDVIVSARLIVRVAGTVPDAALRETGFVRMEAPSIGSCPYRVTHYIFKQ